MFGQCWFAIRLLLTQQFQMCSFAVMSLLSVERVINLNSESTIDLIGSQLKRYQTEEEAKEGI